MKFVHAADIHLDSPLRGLDRYEGAPAEEFRGATRRALEQLVELCLKEQVDFLVIAGDLYDGNWKDYRTGLYFARQMSRLRAANVPVYLLRGNHDAESVITRSLRLPENVRELSAAQPETLVDERLGIAVHGQSFRERAVTEDLAARYPEPRAGLFNLGVLHTCVTGRSGHDRYAPTTVETLAQRGYQYWALGHVHQREILCRDPWIVFPGNLQGRHARETGEKGATLVTVDNGRVQAVEARALDVVRWAVINVDAGGAATPDEVVDRVRRDLERAAAEAGDRPLAVKVRVVGSTRAHAALIADPDRWVHEIRAAANDLSTGAGVWVEKVRLRAKSPLDLQQLATRDDGLGQLVRALEQLRTDEEAQRELLAAFEGLKLPPELREGEDGLRLDDPQLAAGLVDDLEQLLVPRLVDREAGREAGRESGRDSGREPKRGEREPQA